MQDVHCWWFVFSLHSKAHDTFHCLWESYKSQIESSVFWICFSIFVWNSRSSQELRPEAGCRSQRGNYHQVMPLGGKESTLEYWGASLNKLLRDWVSLWICSFTFLNLSWLQSWMSHISPAHTDLPLYRCSVAISDIIAFNYFFFFLELLSSLSFCSRRSLKLFLFSRAVLRKNLQLQQLSLAHIITLWGTFSTNLRFRNSSPRL